MRPTPEKMEQMKRKKAQQKELTRNTMARLSQYLSSEHRAIALSIALLALSALIALAGPPLLQKVTDLISDNIFGILPMDEIVKLSVILLVVYLICAVMKIVGNDIITKISQRFAYRLRREIHDKTDRLSLKYIDSRSKGDIVGLTMNDVDTLSNSVYQLFTIAVSSIITLLGTTILMFVTEWRLALITLVISFIGIILVSTVIAKARKYYIGMQQDQGKLTGFVTENYNTHRIVDLYGGRSNADKEFSVINGDVRKSVWYSSIFSNTAMPMLTFARYLSMVVMALCAAYMLSKGSITLGVLAAFLLYVNMFSTPLIQMSQIMVMVQSATASAVRIFGYLDEPEVVEENECKGIVSKGHVEFRNVSFGYTEDRELIHDFSIDIKPGQKVAIVGPTGAGKTTLVNLLMRFYDIWGGDIFIDGISTKDMARKEVHDQFCMVLQETWVFTGTVRDNVVFNREGVTDDDVARACEAVGLSAFIESLPNGYDTVLDGNNALSEGQKQQLTLARAVVDRSPMLILDEATSTIDTRLERRIQDVMDGLSVGRTSFVIAHRLSTIRNADVILVMKDGAIVEQGTHDELLCKNGLYKELYESQFSIPEI